MGTQWVPVLVVSPIQPDVRVLVSLIGTDVDHAESASVPDSVEAGLLAGPRVGDDLADVEPGETGLEVGEVAREKGQVFVGGRAKGRRQVPVGGQVVGQELTGVTVVAIHHAADAGTPIWLLDGCVGTCSGPLVVARVDDEARIRVQGGCVSTDVSTCFVVTVAPLLALLLGRTRPRRRLVAAGFHARAAHMGAGLGGLEQSAAYHRRKERPVPPPPRPV